MSYPKLPWAQQLCRHGGVESRRAYGGLRIWDIATGDTLLTLLGHGSAVSGVAWMPDGRSVLSAGAKDGSLRLWDLESGAELQRFTEHQGFVWRVAFSPDGRHALSGAMDHR